MPEPRRPVDPAITALDEDDRVRLLRLVLAMRSRGVADTAILAAIEQVPRKLFASAEDRQRAFDDRPLAIECGQTATAPSTIGLMLQALRVAPGHRVLDVGTGSGFAAAVLSRMAARVHTIDRYRTLVDLAVARFAALRLDNVEAMVADGRLGWPSAAPFDRILVSAADESVPEALIAQLAADGVLVMPVGAPGKAQSLLRLTRGDGGILREAVMPVRFVTLVAGRAAAL